MKITSLEEFEKLENRCRQLENALMYDINTFKALVAFGIDIQHLKDRIERNEKLLNKTTIKTST